MNILKSLLKQFGIALFLMIVFIFLLSWWLGYTTNHSQGIKVPNLSKKSIEEVTRELKVLDLKYEVVDSASYNPNFPKNTVVSQNPSPGAYVKENRKIYLTLNPSKYRSIKIPDLNGKTKRQAATHLRSLGFRVGDKPTFVPDIGKDVVRGLKYKGKQVGLGDKCPKNSIINLILGDGTK